MTESCLKLADLAVHGGEGRILRFSPAGGGEPCHLCRSVAATIERAVLLARGVAMAGEELRQPETIKGRAVHYLQSDAPSCHACGGIMPKTQVYRCTTCGYTVTA